MSRQEHGASSSSPACSFRGHLGSPPSSSSSSSSALTVLEQRTESPRLGPARLCNGSANHLGAESPTRSVFLNATSGRRQEICLESFRILPRDRLFSCARSSPLRRVHVAPSRLSRSQVGCMTRPHSQRWSEREAGSHDWRPLRSRRDDDVELEAPCLDRSSRNLFETRSSGSFVVSVGTGEAIWNWCRAAHSAYRWLARVYRARGSPFSVEARAPRRARGGEVAHSALPPLRSIGG